MGLQLEMLKLTLALLFIVVGLAYGTEYSPPSNWHTTSGKDRWGGVGLNLEPWDKELEKRLNVPRSPGNWKPDTDPQATGYRYGKHGSYNDKGYDKKDNKGYDKKYNKGYDKHSEESKEETKSYGGKKDKYGKKSYGKKNKHYNNKKGYDKHSEESTEETKSSSPEKSYDKKSYGKKSYGKKSYGKKNKHYGSSRNWNPRNMDPPPFFPVYEDIRGYRYGKGPKASRGIVSEEHGAEPWHGERETYGNPYRTALDLGKDVDLGSIRLPGVAEPLTLRIKVQPDPNPSKPVEEPVPEEAAEETEKPTASRPAARGPWRHPRSPRGPRGQPRGGGFR